MRKLIRLVLIIGIIYFGYIYCKNNNIDLNDIKDKLIIVKDKAVDLKEKYIDPKLNGKKTINITLAGDLLFEQPFYDAVNNGYDKNEYFSLVKDYFKDDDLSIANMEVVIGNNDMKISGEGYNFCAPEYIGDLVNSLSLEVLSTANNHAYDRKVEGINSTIDYFKNNTNIKTVGTRKSIDDSFLLYLEKNSIKLGITSYTYGTNQKPDGTNKGLINFYRDSNNNINKEKIKRDVEELKNNSDLVIVIMHWGIEFKYEPNNEQKELAKYLNELGVDIIVGSHSHNISPIDVIGDEHKTLVYYSLGNFTSQDDDIARTPIGEEEFDNAYQVGMISKIEVTKEDGNIKFDIINNELVVNYFNSTFNNFKLIPLKDYTEEYEVSHYRYSKGLTKDFINNMYNKVINEEYR